MSEHTPTGREVSDAWMWRRNGDQTPEVSYAEFGRFFDRVKADALREYADYQDKELGKVAYAVTVADINEAARWTRGLRERADQIEAGNE